MTRFWRRAGLSAALLLTLGGALAISAAPASAIPIGSADERVGSWDRYTPVPSDPDCIGAATSFNVTQVSCLYRGANGRIEGYAALDFGGGFNPNNVRTCRVYTQLTTSYGSATTPVAQWDCYTIARRGGYRWFVIPEQHKDWGTGPGVRATFNQYIWVVVESTSGVTYDGRSVAAKKSITF